VARKEGLTVDQLKAKVDANRAGLRQDFLSRGMKSFQARCEAYPEILLSPQLDRERSQADLVRSVRLGPGQRCSPGCRSKTSISKSFPASHAESRRYTSRLDCFLPEKTQPGQRTVNAMPSLGSSRPRPPRNAVGTRANQSSAAGAVCVQSTTSLRVAIRHSPSRLL